jgi:hypothetical protein
LQVSRKAKAARGGRGMKGRTGRFLLIGLIIVFLLVASRIIGFYVDLLFFEEVGYEKVFLRVFSTEVLTGLISRKPGTIPSRQHRLP